MRAWEKGGARRFPNPGALPALLLLHAWEMGKEPARGGPPMGDRDMWLRMHHLSTADISPLCTAPQNPSPQYLLFQVEGGLPVEALVLRLHVSEACEVVGIHEREVDLRGKWCCATLRSWGSEATTNTKVTPSNTGI